MKIITPIKNSNNKYIVKIMNNLFFRTQNTLTGFILRLTLGIIFFPHGMQKNSRVVWRSRLQPDDENFYRTDASSDNCSILGHYD